MFHSKHCTCSTRVQMLSKVFLAIDVVCTVKDGVNIIIHVPTLGGGDVSYIANV